jgi:hypothetical protein
MVLHTLGFFSVTYATGARLPGFNASGGIECGRETVAALLAVYVFIRMRAALEPAPDRFGGPRIASALVLIAGVFIGFIDELHSFRYSHAHGMVQAQAGFGQRQL